MGASTVTPRSTTTRGSHHTVRRHELDWLRTAAVFGLIPFHTAIIFTTGSYDYVKNAQTSAFMDLLTSFVSIWGIPLLFLVAGGASRFALASRGVSRYLNERVARLVVPFIFGMLLVVPLQIYIGRLSSPKPPTFFASYGEFIQTLLGVLTGHFPAGPEWIGHLWFIPPLILFAALAVPFAWLLRQPRARRVVDWLARSWHGYATLALFGLPLAAVQYFTLAGVGWIGAIDIRFLSSAIGVVAYLFFFLYGYLLYLDERFSAHLRRDAGLTLLLGAVAWIALEYILPEWQGLNATPALAHTVLALARGYCSWWWVAGILGMGIRYLQFTTPTVEYLSQAAYPVYIIHMPILSFIAYWVVRTDLDILAKFLVIIISSLAVALAIYDLLIRRIGILRLLFGLNAGMSDGHPPQTNPPHMGARPAPRHKAAGGAGSIWSRRVAQSRL
jgi:peptidoglycan/LPS O-acetylase OafA/YrhL